MKKLITKERNLSEETYYQRHRNVILKRAKDYYKNDKERLHFSEEKKNKKSEYGRNRYHNMSEEKKRKLKEYQRNYLEANKSKKTYFLWI